MKNRFNGLAQIALLVAVLAPTQAAACEFHNDLSLQNSFGEFHLPSVGDYATAIAQVYGEPLRKLNGFNGLDIWDYGSFRGDAEKQQSHICRYVVTHTPPLNNTPNLHQTIIPASPADAGYRFECSNFTGSSGYCKNWIPSAECGAEKCDYVPFSPYGCTAALA